MNKRLLNMGSAAALVVTMGLVGCGKQDNQQALDDMAKRSVAQVEEKAKEAGAEMKSGVESAKDATQDMARDAKQNAKEASDRMGDKVADAMITTSVNAELARDANLSALKINVDTESGRVALHGSAPSTQARDRATTLALAVKGVVSVDNQLTVEPKKIGG